MGFEPTTTEFRSDALIDCAIRTWVQHALRANQLQVFQFCLFVQCLHFISTIAFVSCHISFKRNLAQVITLVAAYINVQCAWFSWFRAASCYYFIWMVKDIRVTWIMSYFIFSCNIIKVNHVFYIVQIIQSKFMSYFF